VGQALHRSSAGRAQVMAAHAAQWHGHPDEWRRRAGHCKCNERVLAMDRRRGAPMAAQANDQFRHQGHSSRGLRRLTCSSTTLFCKVPVRFDSLEFFEMVRLIALRAPFAKMFLLVLPGVAQPKNQSCRKALDSTSNDARRGNNDDGSAGAFAIKPRGRGTVPPMRSLRA
jgi:hypothetical protein